MSGLDWERVLREQGTEYVTQGPNVKRGNINIKCPFCGPADPSHHMGIDLTTGYWACWRNKGHRGKAPHPVLRQLYGWTAAYVDTLVGTAGPDLGAYGAAVARLRGAKPAAAPARTLALPASFRPLVTDGRLTGGTRPVSYLNNRGILRKHVVGFARRYRLHYAPAGDWRGRLIIPVYEGERLVTWTGRALSKRATLRYRALTADPAKADGGPCAVYPIKETVYNADRATGGRALYILEGPFDAMNVDYFSPPDVCATCIWGVDATARQLSVLHDIARGYEYTYVLFDAGAYHKAMQLESGLRAAGARTRQTPAGFEDPGALTPGAVRTLTGS